MIEPVRSEGEYGDRTASGRPFSVMVTDSQSSRICSITWRHLTSNSAVEIDFTVFPLRKILHLSQQFRQYHQPDGFPQYCASGLCRQQFCLPVEALPNFAKLASLAK